MVDICWPGPGHFPTQVLQNSAHAQNCLERPCGSVLWQSGTHKSQERYQHKFEQRSRNTSVLWQSGTRKCPEWYQQILEYHSRNTSVFWQSGTPTPFGIYNIVLGARAPNGKTASKRICAPSAATFAANPAKNKCQPKLMPD